jgi:hypothetical protein
VDGRGATAYPDVLLRDYFKLVQSDFNETAWNAVLEKYRIDTVLWVRAHDELRRFLIDPQPLSPINGARLSFQSDGAPPPQVPSSPAPSRWSPKCVGKPALGALLLRIAANIAKLLDLLSRPRTWGR